MPGRLPLPRSHHQYCVTWGDAVARPRTQYSAFVSARAFRSAVLLLRHLKLHSYLLPSSYADLYSALHGHHAFVLLGCYIEPLASRSDRAPAAYLYIHTSRYVFLNTKKIASLQSRASRTLYLLIRYSHTLRGRYRGGDFYGTYKRRR